MMVPAWIAAAFEMIESQLALQIAILHFDRPATAGDPHERLERRGGRQVAEVVLPFVVDERFLAQQPPLAATLRNAHAYRREAGFERPLRTASPSNAMPRGRGQAVGERRQRLAWRVAPQ